MLRGLVLGVPLFAACGFSVAGSTGGDDDVGLDSGVDESSPEDDAGPQRFCIGSFTRVCLETAPTVEYVVDQNVVFNTDTGEQCAVTVDDTAQGMCVVPATQITIPAGFTVRARGSRPLVLVASGAIFVKGTIDVASHLGQPAGAGANAAACVAGMPPSVNGGGSGGSFGGTGGNGGAGGAGSLNPGSAAGGSSAMTALRGGCAGRNGGGAMPGLGGAGGGAIALVADSLSIDGVINASGAPGTGGVAGAAGGGGGGSGGAIVLDATTSIELAGSTQLFAQGGGGGEGSGTSTTGFNGGEATMAGVPASGSGSNSSSGGDGSAGAATGNAQPGGNGTNGGGGGGGSAGRIKAIASAAPGMGIVSPPFE